MSTLFSCKRNRLNVRRCLLVLALLLITTFAYPQLTFYLQHRPSFLVELLIKSNPTTSLSVTSSYGLIDVATDTLFGYIVKTSDGNFLERVREFDLALDDVRRRVFKRRQGDGATNDEEFELWNDQVLRVKRRPLVTISGALDDYIEKLARKHNHVTTVVLPWLPLLSTSNNAGDSKSKRWNSLSDRKNLLNGGFYQWTADDGLCDLIESTGAIRARYDVIFNRTCFRDIVDGATNRVALNPVFLYNKPINRKHYWPNNGTSYPSRFYVDPPPFVYHLHIHTDAIANWQGDVSSGNTTLMLYVCRWPGDREPTSKLPRNASSLPVYDELITFAQHWGKAVFHRTVEVLPRIVPYLGFLQRNPSIRIHGAEKKGGRLGEIMRIFGIEPSRLVAGNVRAKIVYQPRATGCGMASVQETQLMSKLFRDYIQTNATKKYQKRNTVKIPRLIMIRRSGNRKFLLEAEVEAVVQSAARDYNLTYTLFRDNPTPTLHKTMLMFNEAVLVVAPHGAGLSNIVFSEPGSFVVEGVCNEPHVNLCFQRLAHVLGHRYHGIMSRGGCERVVHVLPRDIDHVVRLYLQVWRKEVGVLH